MSFVHLHVHSEYSLLDGACRLRDLVAAAKALGQDAVAITDHGVMYGAVNFYKEAKAAGIKPIIGCEVYVAPRTRFDKEYDLDSNRHHLVLLCRDETGYRNLCQMVSASFTEGFYGRPRVDMELLRSYSGGLIALSACMSGEIPKLLLEGRYADAKAKTLELRDLFGEDGFYLELQEHKLPDQPAINEGIIRLRRETGVPLVVTNDVHYIKRDDAYAQDVLMCIQTGKTIDDTDRMRFDTQELYLKSEDEMRALFPEYPEAADNTVKIAEQCNLDFDFSSHHLPEFKLPEGETSAAAYLKKLCDRGFKRRYGDNRPEVMERLDYELSMIDKMGFTDYFLIVSDFIAYAKGRGIPVGPGRGSAAGSVASYCLDITTVDPIKYGLYFERFLNPERVSMPDIDIDFCERRRGEVIEYVKRKYGEDRVAQIITFNTLKAKNAVRSVAKALALTFAEENELAREIPFVLGIKLEGALNASKRLRDMYENDTRIKRVIDTAMALEDMPKDSGTHAAGVVITKNPVREYVPLALSKKDNSIATQYTMTTLEELGLLKMDFLGLRNLTIIDNAVREIQRREPDFSIDTIPEDDAATYEMLAAGRTQGVFQMESQGMTAVGVGIKANSIDDIASVIALYRPGPMESIPAFIENSHNPERITYLHPSLIPILEVSYGCIVYQEHVIDILRKIGGYSIGQADLIRRAMSKKKHSEIEKERETFVSGDPARDIPGAVAHGVPREIAARIYDSIIPFAGYGFNKSHAVAYAMIAYQTAYLKCRYPREYMAALLSAVLDIPERVAEYTDECKALGIRILPPDINESGDMFTVAGNDIRYGLVAVKNIGRGFIQGVMTEREKNGPFTGFEEFCRRMYGNDLNRRAVESLIKCGCFDSFGAYRSQLLEICQTVLNSIAEHRRRNLEGQIDLFGLEGTGDAPGSGVELPDMPEFKKSELIAMEYEVTGLYLSGHPMDDYRAAAKAAGAVMIGDILADHANEGGAVKYIDDQPITVAGILTAVKTKPTRNGSVMAYLTVEDGSGSIEMLAFQRIIDTCGGYMQTALPVIVSGRLSARDEKEPQIVVNTLRPASDLDTRGGEAESPARPSENGARRLYVKLPGEDDAKYERIKLILTMFPGKEQMVIYFEDTKKKLGASCVIHEALVAELRSMLGDESVVVK